MILVNGQIQFQISDHSSAMVLPCANFLYVNFPRTSPQSSPLKTTLTIGIKSSQEQQTLNHVAKSFPNRFQSKFFGGESSNSQRSFSIKSSHIYRRSNSQHIFGIKSIHIYWRRVWQYHLRRHQFLCKPYHQQKRQI